jgi:LSM domain
MPAFERNSLLVPEGLQRTTPSNASGVLQPKLRSKITIHKQGESIKYCTMAHANISHQARFTTASDGKRGLVVAHSRALQERLAAYTLFTSMVDPNSESEHATDLKSGPFSVLYNAVRKNTQILVNVRNDHKLLGRVKAYDRHMNL